jgi:hypothetical protein
MADVVPPPGQGRSSRPPESRGGSRSRRSRADERR